MHSGHRGMRQVSEYELLGTVATEIGYDLLAMIKTFCFHLFLTEIVLFNNKKHDFIVYVQHTKFKDTASFKYHTLFANYTIFIIHLSASEKITFKFPQKPRFFVAFSKMDNR